MPDPVHRFLRHRPTLSNQAPLGRVYGVTRQSWFLDADPSKVKPETQVIATARSAAEAADIARTQAIAMVQSGFHKPSGAWWGVQGAKFHRFIVAVRPRRKTAAALAAGLVGIGLIAVLHHRKTGPRT